MGLEPETGVSPGCQLLWRWLPLVGWMAIIYLLSTDYLSFPALRRTWTGFFVAKGVHVSEYAILSVLWYRALNGRLDTWNATAAALGFVFASAYGLFDEAHQVLTRERSGNVQDFLLDTSGALVAVTALWSIRRKRAV